MEGFEAISGVGLADDKGNYYLLKQFKGHYVNRIVKDGSKTINPQEYEWSNYKGELNLVSKDTLDDVYDPRLRPWYRPLV